MRFVFSESAPIVGRHTFKDGEGLMHSLMGSSEIALMTGCTYLRIDITTQNNRIYGISGYVSLKNLKREKIVLPSEIMTGSVVIKDHIFTPEITSDYEDVLDGKFDSEQQCICLGDDKCRNATTVKISDDVFISIDKDKIVAIFIKPIFL